MTAIWPDRPAATTPGMTVRSQLDYLVWISEAMEPIGFHPPPELDAWRRRVQLAFGALVDSFTLGHGDPLPPDVPPAVRPGEWPDIPAHSIPGMHVRHQLTVIRTVAGISRASSAFPRTPADVATWTARVQTAFDALDHGPTLPMPESFRTAAPPPPERPASSKGKRPGGRSSAGRPSGAEAKSAAKKPAKKHGKARR